VFAPPSAPAETLHGNWGCYVLADQVVFRRGPPEKKQEVGLFASFLFAPDQRINKMPFFCNGGVVARGLVPARPLDYAGFGLIFGAFSKDLQRAQRAQQETDPSVGVQHYEMALEWTYSIHVAPGVRVQPDLQYIIKPGATGQIANALVLGTQVGFNF
jgi:porin